MPQERHLYEYLYQSLLTQIECGYLLPGQKLPSQSGLCNQYQVGITTVRKVLRLLADAGYIRTLPGQPAEIIYSATPQDYARALLRRRKGISDAFSGLSVLMPVLYCEGARRCGPAELRRMQQAVDGLSADLTQSEIYQRANRFFGCLLQPFHNPLLMDLQADAETYLRVPYLPFPEIEDPSLLSFQGVKTRLTSALKLIRQGSFDHFYAQASDMYRRAHDNVQRYMTALSHKIPCGDEIEESYRWFTSKGHAELYLQVALSLLRRISTGEFKGQIYLPSIPSLMREYGVMKNTASRAIALLGALGITQTLDKKGTVLTDESASPHKMRFDLTDHTIQKRLVLCLDALQIMALTANASAQMVFAHLHEEYFVSLEAKLTGTNSLNQGSVAVQLMTGCLIQFSPYHSMKNIYRQLNEAILWGYYLKSVAEEEESPYPKAIQEAFLSFIKAAKEKDCNAFAASMQSAFTLIYMQTRQIVSAVTDDRLCIPIPIYR